MFSRIGLPEGRGLLEHHAYGLAELEEVLVRRVYVVVVIVDLALDHAARNLAVHEVEAAQVRRLTAARGDQ
jgi:hypothetical protein